MTGSWTLMYDFYASQCRRTDQGVPSSSSSSSSSSPRHPRMLCRNPTAQIRVVPRVTERTSSSAPSNGRRNPTVLIRVFQECLDGHRTRQWHQGRNPTEQIRAVPRKCVLCALPPTTGAVGRNPTARISSRRRLAGNLVRRIRCVAIPSYRSR